MSLGLKFKLIQNQSKNDYAFIENKNYLLKNLIKKDKSKSKIYRVNYKKYQIPINRVYCTHY